MNNIEQYIQSISDDAPAGIDAQYESCFESMEAEIKKFGSLFGETVDWRVVADNAQIVIAEHSKDLKALSYLTRAWYENSGLSGLNDALSVFAGCLDCAGANVYPSRPRRRDGAIEWINKHTELMLSGREFDWDDQPSLERAAQLATALCDKYFEIFEDAEVSLIGMKNAIKDKLQYVELNCQPLQSDTEAPKEETLVVEPITTEALPPSNSKSVEIDSVSEVNGDLPADAKPHVETSSVSPADTVDKTSTQSNKVLSVSNHDQPLFDVKPIGDLAELNRTLANSAKMVLGAQPDNLMTYAINRFVAWSDIDSVPGSNTDKNTELRLPIAEAFIEEIDASISQGMVDIPLIVRLENSLVNAPFWLTGQYLLSQLLLNANFIEAAQVVKLATQAFITRLPNLAELRFVDNQAFCDQETCEWLNEKLATSSSTGTQALPPPTPIDLDGFEYQTLDEANFAQVMFKAGALLSGAHSGREKFIVNLQLAQMLFDSNLPHLSWPYLETIGPIRKQVNLELWEPQLSHQYDALSQNVLISLYGELESVPEVYRSWVNN